MIYCIELRGRGCASGCTTARGVVQLFAGHSQLRVSREPIRPARKANALQIMHPLDLAKVTSDGRLVYHGPRRGARRTSQIDG